MTNKIEKVKVQITLPKKVFEQIEEELKKSYLSKSAWFLKAALSTLEKNDTPKKVINLDI